jgi:predicted anti-sigma-YlaC factor YlaD
MDCATCRESLSARIDGEAEPVLAALVDEHVRACASCRTWRDRVADLSRSLRVRAAVSVPDLSRAILGNAPSCTRDWWPRGALVGVAVAQLGLAVAQLFGVVPTAAHLHHDAVSVANHLFNEGTAWNLALGVGLLWAAFHPRTASGQIPVLGGFLLVLLACSTHDLVVGTVPVTRVAGHGLLVAGLILLVLVNPALRSGIVASGGHAPSRLNGGRHVKCLAVA